MRKSINLKIKLNGKFKNCWPIILKAFFEKNSKISIMILEGALHMTCFFLSSHCNTLPKVLCSCEAPLLQLYEVSLRVDTPSAFTSTSDAQWLRKCRAQRWGQIWSVGWWGPLMIPSPSRHLCWGSEGERQISQRSLALTSSWTIICWTSQKNLIKSPSTITWN